MKKIITLFIVILGLSLSSFSNSVSTNDKRSYTIENTSKFEYDYTLRIGAYNGASARIGISVPNSGYVSNPMWIDVDVSSGDIVLKLNYELWQDFGAPEEELIYVRIHYNDPSSFPKTVAILLQIG